jgi:hypothetical protein
LKLDLKQADGVQGHRLLLAHGLRPGRAASGCGGP